MVIPPFRFQELPFILKNFINSRCNKFDAGIFFIFIFNLSIFIEYGKQEPLNSPLRILIVLTSVIAVAMFPLKLNKSNYQVAFRTIVVNAILLIFIRLLEPLLAKYISAYDLSLFISALVIATGYTLGRVGEAKRITSKIEEMINTYDLDSNFTVINLLASRVDLRPLNPLKEKLNTRPFNLSFAIHVPITLDNEIKDYEITLPPNHPDKYLVGLTFTGYEFIICALCKTLSDASRATATARDRILKLTSRNSGDSIFDGIDTLKISQQTVDFELSPESELYKGIRFSIRRFFVDDIKFPFDIINHFLN